MPYATYNPHSVGRLTCLGHCGRFPSFYARCIDDMPHAAPPPHAHIHAQRVMRCVSGQWRFSLQWQLPVPPSAMELPVSPSRNHSQGVRAAHEHLPKTSFAVLRMPVGSPFAATFFVCEYVWFGQCLGNLSWGRFLHLFHGL